MYICGIFQKLSTMHNEDATIANEIRFQGSRKQRGSRKKIKKALDAQTPSSIMRLSMVQIRQHSQKPRLQQ
jgi:hypothetical protein